MPPQDQTHRVYLSFQFRDDWRCQFLEQDLKTPLPRKLHFASPDKIVELVERGGGFKDLADRQSLDHGVAMGRGGKSLHPPVGLFAPRQCRTRLCHLL
jgi:hypothetical protein